MTYCYLVGSWIKQDYLCLFCNKCKIRLEEIRLNDAIIEKYLGGKNNMLKCWDCEYKKELSKGTLTPGGKQNYIITCKKECVSFEAVWNTHISDLPCWEGSENEKKD